jgi:hypothetical protein
MLLKYCEMLVKYYYMFVKCCEMDKKSYEVLIKCKQPTMVSSL